MKPPTPQAGLLAAFLIAAAVAFWGAAPAGGAGSKPAQAAPAAGAPAPPPAQPKALTLEERADIFMARKNYADAADYYFQVLKQSSFKDSTVWNKLGLAFQQQSKFPNALKAYAGATRVDKNFAEAWNNQGTVYFMEKRYRKSLKYYQRAIELKGDVAAFHMNLGTSYLHVKRFDEAGQEYRTALSIDPKVATHESSVGAVVYAGGANAEFFFYMAKAFASVGNAEDAVRYLRHALEDGFNDPKRIDNDPDFKKISQHPAFVELMRNPPVAIKE